MSKRYTIDRQTNGVYIIRRNGEIFANTATSEMNLHQLGRTAFLLNDEVEPLVNRIAELESALRNVLDGLPLSECAFCNGEFDQHKFIHDDNCEVLQGWQVLDKHSSD